MSGCVWERVYLGKCVAEMVICSQGCISQAGKHTHTFEDILWAVVGYVMALVLCRAMGSYVFKACSMQSLLAMGSGRVQQFLIQHVDF